MPGLVEAARISGSLDCILQQSLMAANVGESLQPEAICSYIQLWFMIRA